MNGRSGKIWMCIAVLFAFAVIYYMLAPMFAYPGRIIVNNGGDAGKNYYTYLYHCLYGRGVWFGGMNYPFGEHIIYTDAQPVLSVTLSYLRSVFPISIGGALAVMHLSMALSYMLAIVFSYRILVHYKVGHLAAILFASMVIVMSPQTYRIDGHFALSHACFLPMFFYWVIQYGGSRRPKYIGYLLLLSVFFTFMHPYYLAMGLLFSAFYCLGYVLFSKGKLVERIKGAIPVISVPVATMVILKLFLAFTDPATDRPEWPAGTMATVTEKADILSAFYSPVSIYAHEQKWLVVDTNVREGAAYVGLSALLITIISLIILLVRAFKRNKEELSSGTTSPRVAGIWLTVALCSLLLGMGVPFIWNEDLLDSMSLFRQFRSLGRFSNIYYYVVALYAGIVLYRWHIYILRRGIKWLAFVVLLIPMVPWAIEARSNIENIKEDDEKQLLSTYDFFFSPDVENWNVFLADKGLKPSGFQSIVTLPFTHIGSEKIWVNPWHIWNMVISFKASLQLQLPINNVLMSRTSWSQTKEQVRLAAGPWADRSILDKCGSNRPFLVLVFDEVPIPYDHAYLLQASDSLGVCCGMKVYACYPDRLRANDARHYDEVRAVCETMPPGDTCAVGANANWLVQHFDQRPATDVFFGKGALPATVSADTVIAEMVLSARDSDELFELSCWVFADTTSYRTPYFTVDKLDSAGNVLATETIATSESVDNDGKWFRAALYFNLPVNCARLSVQLHAGVKNSYISVDELQIRPARSVIISRSATGELMINNHLQRKRKKNVDN